MLQSPSRPGGVDWELASSMLKPNKKQTEELFSALELDETEVLTAAVSELGPLPEFLQQRKYPKE